MVTRLVYFPVKRSFRCFTEAALVCEELKIPPSSCEFGTRTQAAPVSHSPLQSQIGMSESDQTTVDERIAKILKVREGIPANAAQAEADVEVPHPPTH